MPNPYEEKQAKRRERLLRAAEAAEAESERRWKASHDAVAHIPLGQPILVGHHSEKAHRAALRRCHNHADKGLEAHNRAVELKAKAAAVGKGGISSDDPEAVTKLEAKLAKMTKQRDTMKEINRLWRKAGKPGANEPERWEPIEKAVGLELTKLRLGMEGRYSWEQNPFPPYVFQNLGQNIKRVEGRIKELEQREKVREVLATEEPLETRGSGYVIKEDLEDNRIHFIFDEKPEKEVCRLMRTYGFRWSPQRVAWVRQLNERGRINAQWAAKAIEGRLQTVEPSQMKGGDATTVP